MRARDAFAYPFKVLRDVFTDPPFVPEPEFKRFDLTALQDEDSEGGIVSKPKRGRARMEKIRISVLLLVLVAIVIALIVVG
jgi:hypothetical protein